MLVQFTIENYRPIRDTAVISFAASKDTSMESCLLHPDDKRVLFPSLALYGANAAGKSNVLNALMVMKDMIIGDTSRISKGQPIPYEPFGNTVSPTSLEAVFYYNGIRYAYGYSFDAEKIHNEYLYHWPKGREALIFSREDGQYEFRENVNEQTILSNRTPENRLYLVSSNDWNLKQTENPYRWFQEKLTFFMDQAPDASETVARIISGDDEKALVLKELLLADLGISDITIKNADQAEPFITTTHRIDHEDGREEYFSLPLELESAGTERFFSRIGGWLHALESGSLLVVDEIEDSLHPLLTRRLIEMVQDSAINTHGTQIIFTTHDAMLLDLSFLRRDQIWFAEKNEHSCATEVFSLSTFSPRKGENIRKGYLQGRFGAIPFIGGDYSWQK